jgi:hypothetical protein
LIAVSIVTPLPIVILWSFDGQIISLSAARRNIFVTLVTKNFTTAEIQRQKKRPEALFSLGNLLAAWDAETLVEAVNTATGSNITLLASIERVAFTAHVQVQVVTNGRADLHDVTARTSCSNFFVFRVNIFFHGKTSVKAASLFQP